MTSLTPESAQPASALERQLWWNPGCQPSRLIRLARLLVNVFGGAFSDCIWIRAGYMTYLSLFHLVPLGALALALAGQLGWGDNLVEWIAVRLSPTAPELSSNLVAAMQRLDLFAVGVIGLGAVLIVGVIGVSEVEEFLSEIWHAPAARQWWKRLLLYPLAIALVPALLAIVLALGTMAEARTTEWIVLLSEWGSFSEWLYHLLLNVPVLFRIVPYAMTWVGLTLIYYFITSAPVQFRSAAVGGVTAGVIWQLAQQAYIGFQFGVSTYREIWGYLAQVPLLILWIYLSWLIFYIGAEVVFAWQYRNAFLPKWAGVPSRSIALEEGAVRQIYAHVVSRHGPECREICTPDLSCKLLMPWTLVEFVARRMADRGLLAQRRTSAGFCYSLPVRRQSLSDAQLLAAYRGTPAAATHDSTDIPPDMADGDSPSSDGIDS